MPIVSSEFSQADIDAAVTAAIASGDPEIMRKTIQAVETVTEANESH